MSSWTGNHIRRGVGEIKNQASSPNESSKFDPADLFHLSPPRSPYFLPSTGSDSRRLAFVAAGGSRWDDLWEWGEHFLILITITEEPLEWSVIDDRSEKEEGQQSSSSVQLSGRRNSPTWGDGRKWKAAIYQNAARWVTLVSCDDGMRSSHKLAIEFGTINMESSEAIRFKLDVLFLKNRVWVLFSPISW